MKKLFILFSFCALLVCISSPPEYSLKGSVQTEFVQATNIFDYSTLEVAQEGYSYPLKISEVVISADEIPANYPYYADAGASPAIQDSPPNANYGDVLDIPGKDDPKSDWFYWGISIAVLILWEVVFRLVPTSKSITVLSLLYNLFNLLLKDRETNGGIFKVKRE